MEIVDDDLEILDLIENGFPRRVLNRNNHFDEMDNLTFFRRFSLTKPTVLNVLEQIEEHLEYEHDRNNSISPINQLLTCLRCYATGGHLSSVADLMGIGISSASRTVRNVSEVIASLRQRYFEMPVREDALSTSNKFFQMASFPRVLGCIDGTQVRIQSPGGDDGEVFRNRKGYFFINTQILGDADLKIRDIVACWPGSTHDQTIFLNSRISVRLENNEFPNSVILGDSGYALKRYLMTPLPEPQNRAQQLYNTAHIQTRNSIERLIGVWKRRFPVLAYGCRLKLTTTLALVPATAILHNITIDNNETEPPAEANINELNYLIEIGNVPDIQHNEGGMLQGQNVRNQMINYFAGL